MVAIELDKPRNLLFELSDIRDLEKALDGRPLGSVLRDLSQLGINALILCMYYGLRHEDRGLSIKLVEKMVSEKLRNGGSLGPLYEALPKALDETGLFRSGDDVGKQETPALQ